MTREAQRPISPMRRKVPDWHHTERATFIPYPPTQKADRTIARRLSASQLWIPLTHNFAGELAINVREYGQKNQLKALSEWVPNRLGFNYLHGSVSDPALIREHVDVPEEHGLVIAINLGYTKEFSPGSMSFILGFDTCQELGIQQSRHEITSTEERVGLSIAHLVLV